jgi:hypothetical protein
MSIWAVWLPSPGALLEHLVYVFGLLQHSHTTIFLKLHMSTVVTSWSMYKTIRFSRELCLLWGSELQHVRLFHGTNPGISNEFLEGEKARLGVMGVVSFSDRKLRVHFFVESSPPSKFRRIFYCAVNLYETAWNVRHMSTADDVVIRCLTRKTNPWRTRSIINQSLCNFSTNLKEYEVILRLLFLPCRRQHGVIFCYYSRQDARKKEHSCGFWAVLFWSVIDVMYRSRSTSSTCSQ